MMMLKNQQYDKHCPWTLWSKGADEKKEKQRHKPKQKQKKKRKKAKLKMYRVAGTVLAASALL